MRMWMRVGVSVVGTLLFAVAMEMVMLVSLGGPVLVPVPVTTHGRPRRTNGVEPAPEQIPAEGEHDEPGHEAQDRIQALDRHDARRAERDEAQDEDAGGV